MVENVPDHKVSTADADLPQATFEDHRRTYEAFTNLTKWGIIIVVLILIGMAVFLL